MVIGDAEAFVVCTVVRRPKNAARVRRLIRKEVEVDKGSRGGIAGQLPTDGLRVRALRKVVGTIVFIDVDPPWCGCLVQRDFEWVSCLVPLGY
jgi:hypothetical protein